MELQGLNQIGEEANSFFKWSPGDIKCLISLYGKNKENFDNKQKAKVWQDIAKEISEIRRKNISAEKCIGKWKGLKAQYKKIKDHNNISGNSPKHWEYFEELDEILFLRPEINPPAVCSSDESAIALNDVQSGDIFDFADIIVDESSHSSSVVTPAKKRKAAAEEDKAKRHREKIERTDKFLELMARLVDHVTCPQIAEGANPAY